MLSPELFQKLPSPLSFTQDQYPSPLQLFILVHLPTHFHLLPAFQEDPLLPAAFLFSVSGYPPCISVFKVGSQEDEREMYLACHLKLTLWWLWLYRILKNFSVIKPTNDLFCLLPLVPCLESHSLI